MTFKSATLGLVAIACVFAAYSSETKDGSFGFGLLALAAIIGLAHT